MCASTLWHDEAESSLNGLTILATGVPGASYLGQPIYENTLTELSPEHPEYEFRDSSYSSKGLAIYHGWLPLYSIALAQALAGIEPDHPSNATAPIHSPETIFRRTIAPRMPAVLFSAVFLATIYCLVRGVAGEIAGLASLTWLALNAYTIRFGAEARYYSLTLCLSAVCAYAAWTLYRNGRWRDYLLLGVAEGLFFHTHPLSAFIFAVTCLLLVPRILQQRQWLLKSASAAGIAAGMTIPWALLTGFFDSTSSLPKAHELFSSWRDGAAYVLERPLPGLILLALIAMIAVSLALERFSARHRRQGTSKRIPAYLFLITWLSVAYAAFHWLTPAASFFFQRLTLIAITPLSILIGMALSEMIRPRKALPGILAAIAAPCSLLILTGDFIEAPNNFSRKKAEITSVLNAIETAQLEQPYRIYATPGQQLLWTYYAGIPVQSICPIRKSFLEAFPYDILFIEDARNLTSPAPEAIQIAARDAGLELPQDDVPRLVDLVRVHLIGAQLDQRGLRQWRATTETLPVFLEPLLEQLKTREAEATARQIRLLSQSPIFKHVEVHSLRELWHSFFYRFANYPERIGPESNIWPIQKASTIRIVTPKGCCVYYRKSPHEHASPNQ